MLEEPNRQNTDVRVESAPSASREVANAVRWTPAKRDFYEVHYVQWWDEAGRVAGWLRTMLLASRAGRSEAAVWAGVVDLDDPRRSFTVKEVHSIGDARVSKAPFLVGIGSCEMRSGASAGRIGAGGTAVEWAVSFDEPGMEIAHMPAPLRNLPVPPTKFVSAYCGGRLSGFIAARGRRHDVVRAPAVQSHFWGPKNVVGWSWGHCCSFREDPDFVFDGVCADTELAGARLKPMNIFFFRMDGVVHACNGLVAALFGNRSTRTIDGWRFTARSDDLVFEGEVTARPDEMTLWVHEDPDGDERQAHLTFTADYRITVSRRAGGEILRTLTAPRGGIYEITLPEVDGRITHRHPTHTFKAEAF